MMGEVSILSSGICYLVGSYLGSIDHQLLQPFPKSIWTDCHIHPCDGLDILDIISPFQICDMKRNSICTSVVIKNANFLRNLAKKTTLR